jgi:ribokinase
VAEVVVVGSLSMDFTARADRLPSVGETLIGTAFTMVPGGKGNNQALACLRQGVATAMVGCVGADPLGDALLEWFSAEGLDRGYLIRDEDNGTGIAHITVDGEGRNAIIIVPGSNMALSPDRVRRRADLIRSARVVLTQLEVPVEATAAALALGREGGAVTILNPAPARALDESVLALADICVPNEVEASDLTGRPVGDPDSALRAAAIMHDRGCPEVIVTLGEKGSLYSGPDGAIHVPAFEVETIDTVAAGDAFVGALAAALARGATRAEALLRASAAGALAVTVPGATPSLPTGEAVSDLIALARAAGDRSGNASEEVAR